MASEFLLTTGQVTPKDKGGPRVGIGCRGVAKRVGDGAVTIQIYRGDGAGGGETWDTELRSRTYPVLDGVQTLVQLADLNLGLVNDDPRSYRMRIVADGGADLTVEDPLIAPEPYGV